MSFIGKMLATSLLSMKVKKSGKEGFHFCYQGWKKEPVQKQLVLCNSNEAYQKFQGKFKFFQNLQH